MQTEEEEFDSDGQIKLKTKKVGFLGKLMGKKGSDMDVNKEDGTKDEEGY